MPSASRSLDRVVKRVHECNSTRVSTMAIGAFLVGCKNVAVPCCKCVCALWQCQTDTLPAPCSHPLTRTLSLPLSLPLPQLYSPTRARMHMRACAPRRRP